jgi:hypothetical protein
VRVAEQEHVRFCYGLFKLIKINLILDPVSFDLLQQGRFHLRYAGLPAGFMEFVIDRCLDQIPPFRSAERPRCDVISTVHTRHRDDRVRGDIPAIKFVQTRCNRFIHFYGRQSITQIAMFHIFFKGFQDGRRRGEIHVRDPHG